MVEVVRRMWVWRERSLVRRLRLVGKWEMEKSFPRQTLKDARHDTMVGRIYPSIYSIFVIIS